MFEDVLAEQNPRWASEQFGSSVARSCFSRFHDYLQTGQVVAITGVRQSGKSTLAWQMIEHLIHTQEIPARNILFVNLEHPYLSPYREDKRALQRLYEEYLKIR